MTIELITAADAHLKRGTEMLPALEGVTSSISSVRMLFRGQIVIGLAED